jgi:hypothetical protein
MQSIRITFMAKDSGEQSGDASLFAEVQVGMADTCGLDLNQDFVVTNILVHLDWLKLEGGSRLSYNEGVCEHY